ncbi:MAG: hypothetical protein LBB23_04325 [Rickettsiales bacterium]|jgi:LPS-assembly lipoprotein|nr:hypothetical protein [Rickettsiales bacterium]
MKKLTCIFAVLVSACGWTPLYSTGEKNQLEYPVHIKAIAGAEGVVLRNRIRTELNPFGEPNDPRYTLAVKLNPRAETYKGIQRTGDATWQEIRITASFDLIDSVSGKAVLSDSAEVSESYTFVQNLIAANSASEAATSSALRILSEKISMRIKIFIKSGAAI